jgi:hypothetical protein
LPGPIERIWVGGTCRKPASLKGKGSPLPANGPPVLPHSRFFPRLQMLGIRLPPLKRPRAGAFPWSPQSAPNLRTPDPPHPHSLADFAAKREHPPRPPQSSIPLVQSDSLDAAQGRSGWSIFDEKRQSPGTGEDTAKRSGGRCQGKSSLLVCACGAIGFSDDGGFSAPPSPAGPQMPAVSPLSDLGGICRFSAGAAFLRVVADWLFSLRSFRNLPGPFVGVPKGVYAAIAEENIQNHL